MRLAFAIADRPGATQGSLSHTFESCLGYKVLEDTGTAYYVYDLSR